MITGFESYFGGTAPDRIVVKRARDRLHAMQISGLEVCYGDGRLMPEREKSKRKDYWWEEIKYYTESGRGRAFVAMMAGKHVGAVVEYDAEVGREVRVFGDESHPKANEIAAALFAHIGRGSDGKWLPSPPVEVETQPMETEVGLDPVPEVLLDGFQVPMSVGVVD